LEEFDKILAFIRNLYNEPNNFIPLHAPVFKGNEKKYLIDCIDSTYVSSVGKYVSKFEQMIADYTGAKYAVATVNGTAALHIALKLVGVNSNTHVITQPLTFIATANAINYCGASPIFVDVDKETLGLSPISLRKYLNENTHIKNNQSYHIKSNKPITACVPMHTFGHPCKIDEIKKICEEYNIALVEDAAESLGSFYKNRHTGMFGDIGTLSFNGNKTITTGGGGMLITNNEQLSIKAKHITTTAKVPHEWDYVHDIIGYNYRLTNLAAALGCAQMEQLPDIIQEKQINAKKYSDFFSSLKMNFIEQPENCISNYWLNALILNNKEERNNFLKYSNENKVMTRPIWALMNTLPMFKDCFHSDLNNSEWFADRVVNIPSSVIK
jgi:perosamine synthetase